MSKPAIAPSTDTPKRARKPRASAESITAEVNVAAQTPGVKQALARAYLTRREDYDTVLANAKAIKRECNKLLGCLRAMT